MQNEPTPPPSPALLFCTLAGGLLVILGTSGFFYSSSFASPGSVETAFGVFAVNGWDNVLHIASGALVLAAAGGAARKSAFGLGVFYLAIAIWGLIIGSGHSILGFLPINGADNILHLVIGLLGLAAAAATPALSTLRGRERAPAPRPSSPRPRPPAQGGERS